jgi:flagellar motility protein MotE (MotC chaperone)
MLNDTESLFISNVEAQPVEKASNVSTEKPSEQNNEEKKSSTEDGEHKSEEKKEKENANVSKEIELTTDQRYTSVEVELLQSLSKRRNELDRWEKNIQIKEYALDATQKRIDDKIKQIEAMKKQVTLLLAKYNKQEDAKIHSLVKIYENMKAADAARIFDEVEMPILLLVIDSMAEKKAAPILAAMNPKKAKQLTVELANERKAENSKLAPPAQ